MSFTTNMNPEQVSQLKAFVSALKADPNVLHAAELGFFRDYIESLGGKIPPKKGPAPKETPKTTPAPNDTPPKEEKTAEDSDEEDLPDFVEEEVPDSLVSKEGVIEAETVALPEIFSSDGNEISEDNIDSANSLRSEAIGLMNEGKLDEAVETFTKALKMNPESAVLYAKRAQALLKQKRVKGVIADCDAAIQRNPDSALAHKLRGRAYRLLGDWINSANDLRKACKLDCDEQAMEWLAEVQPNANKIEEHKRGQQRKREERELAQRQQRVRKAKKANQKAYKRSQEESKSFDDDDEGFANTDFLAGLQDPEVAAAFQDIMQNPMNIVKYKDNPKVIKLIEAMKSNMGGAMPGMFGGMGGGFPGGMPGGMGGFPGGMGGAAAGMNKEKPSSEGPKTAPAGDSCMDDLD